MPLVEEGIPTAACLFVASERVLDIDYKLMKRDQCRFSQEPVVDKARMRPGYWLESVLCVLFTVWTLLIG